MLETCREEPVNKTKIMYNAFVSYSQLKSILSELLTAGVLKSVKSTPDKEPYYQTTPRGQHWCKTYRELNSIIKMKIEEEEETYCKINILINYLYFFFRTFIFFVHLDRNFASAFPLFLFDFALPIAFFSLTHLVLAICASVKLFFFKSGF